MLGLAAMCACAQPAPSAVATDAGPRGEPRALESPREAAYAFVDIAVIGMATPELAAHQTVIVQGDAIVELGPAALVEPPRDAVVIDGRGKYLVPGLHDMHVHLDGTRGMLALFVENGVTEVRNMAGSPRILALRDGVAHGELIGPTIVTAGPFVDGARPRWEASDVVARPDDAEPVVAAQVAAGYDFIKVYNGLTPASYDAVIAAAHAHGIRVVGHVPFAVPLAHAIASGQASIEHLTAFAEAIERTDSPVRGSHGNTAMIRRWLYADPARIPRVAADVARSGAWVCPTLVTAAAYGELWRGKLPEAGELDDVSPDWRARWNPAHAPSHVARAVRAAMEAAHGQTTAVELALVRELAAAGAPLLAGTDTPNPYVVPGASLHQELALMVEAGLSPYSALRAATIDAADFLGDPADGRIAVGARANLVVLDADPLADIHAVDRISGVMLHGRWFTTDDLRALHDDLVAAYKAPVWLAPIALPETAGRAVHYVIADNGTPVGAYALARHAGSVIERQTLEDETITTSFSGEHRARTLTIDVSRPTGDVHAEHAASDHLVIGWLSPATAAALLDGLALDIDQQLDLTVRQPDRDAPDVLRKGSLTITRIAPGKGEDEAAPVYRIRLAIDHGAWVARVVLDADGLPQLFKISDTSRPVVRTWRRHH